MITRNLDQTRRLLSGRQLPTGLWMAGLLMAGLCALEPAAAELFRWVDAQGKVHYSDRMPAELAGEEHSLLTEDGIKLRTIERAKTDEEVRRERELERLRAEQQRLVEQQRAADQALLQSYANIDEMMMVRDGKLSAVDAMAQVTKRNIRHQQDWLSDLNAEAERLQASGEPIPPALDRKIADAERALEAAMADRLEHERKKQAIREQFERDMRRFSQLKESSPGLLAADAPRSERSLLDNTVVCRGLPECDRLWSLATEYIRTQSHLPIHTETPDLVMTAPPSSDEEVALTLSRIWDPGYEQASIFLDLQCQDIHAPPQDCETPRRRAALAGFKAAMEAGNADARGR
jgi:hypothetical protein